MKVRVKRIVISPEAFLHIMAQSTAWRVSKGVPKGTRLRGFTVDPYTQSLNLFIEHDSFPEVDVDTVVPLLETEFTKIR
jgi:hypothetical protein